MDEDTNDTVILYISYQYLLHALCIIRYFRTFVQMYDEFIIMRSTRNTVVALEKNEIMIVFMLFDGIVVYHRKKDARHVRIWKCD